MGNKYIEIDKTSREQYRLAVMLSEARDGSKITHLIIIKGEPGKAVETNLRNLSCVKNNNIFIYYRNNAWRTKFIFEEWIKNIYKPYERNIGEKSLLIIDKASSHASYEFFEL